MRLNPPPDETPGLRRRFIVISMIAAVIFGVLLLRLWYLQIVNDERYRELSERNRTRFIHIDAPRGTMYDRNGIMLVDSRPAFTVSVLRQEISDRQALFGRLSQLLGIEPRQLEVRWRAGQVVPDYQPLPLLEDINRATMEIVQEHGIELPGVIVEGKPLRAYPQGPVAPHLLGYLGEVTEEDLQRPEFTGYRPRNLIGKTGLERLFEDKLRGEDGYRLIEVNVRGRELRQLTTQKPSPGQRLTLTLDAKAQAAGEKAFGDQAGAAVALDVRNGDVLAFINRPAFDPAQFARGISGSEWKALIEDPRKPMQNRVLRGQYPPGSTFKIAVALAALEAGVVTPDTTISCSGGITLGSHEFRCWNKGGHGAVSLHRALKESCDVYFYRVGMQLGIDRLAAMCQRLGLGRPVGFPTGGERGGLIPDREWKRKRFGTDWYNGETVICSIGQGYVLATPLQLATMTATVANGGTVWKPRVVKCIERVQGNQAWAPEPEKVVESQWSPANLRALRSALEAVVNEPGGTAYRSRLPEVRFAGKTGTAQVVGRKGDKAADTSKYEYRDHALFVAYAPAVAPEIAVAVVVEHGGHGGSAAAPVAKAMFEAYFGIKREAPPVVEVVEEAQPTPPEGDAPGTAAEAALSPEVESDRTPIPPGVTNSGAEPPAEPVEVPPPPLRPTGE
ncbi:MAG: penicillin-binding protein 2 [Desulfuromonas sp.]|nr:penicillin-binding protein 2 [Desulfuromonas sp.]